ncbi:MAG TPA: hypothetical protein DD490_01755, partial [Acidobacteria bacterium]|nr:hypothetical protein [Acidobacteriota bacterium]
MWLAAALLFGPALASAAPLDKAATYQEMAGLAQQMKSLKAQAGTNVQAAADYAAAEARYRELSTAMGGDDPGHMGINGAPARRSGPTRVVPSTPAGCGPTTTNFAQTTPTAIPTG